MYAAIYMHKHNCKPIATCTCIGKIILEKPWWYCNRNNQDHCHQEYISDHCKGKWLVNYNTTVEFIVIPNATINSKLAVPQDLQLFKTLSYSFIVLASPTKNPNLR